MQNIFHTYIVGIGLNVVAGLIVFLIIRRTLEWLPTSASLHERFRAVASEKNAKDKIVELTPLLFISFFWLFLANMLWVLMEVIIEVLNWPELFLEIYSRVETVLPESVLQWISDAIPGLMFGRSILLIILGLTVATFFANGFAISQAVLGCIQSYR